MQLDRNSKAWSWLLPGLLLAASLGWYGVVAQAEGWIWLSQRFAQSQAVLWPIAGALGLAWLTGFAIGLAVVSEPRWRWIKNLGALALSAGLLARLSFMAHWDKFAGAPDWLAISAVICGGGCLAVGYAGAARRTSARAVWPLLVIPGLLVVATATLTSSLGDLAAVPVLILLCVAVGRDGLQRLGLGAAGFAVSGAAGMSVLIVLFRLLGACGWVSSNGILITLAALAVAVRAQLSTAAGDFVRCLRKPRTFLVSEWAVFGAGIGLTIVFWGSSLAPETGPDAVGARSALPMIWERAGSIIGVREMFTSYMGLGGEIVNLIALPLAGENMAKITALVSAVFLIGCVHTVAGESRRLLSWIAIFVFFSSTVVSWQFIHGFVDMQVAFLTVASMLALESWTAERKNSWLLASGLIAGTAVSVKLHAGTMCVVLTGLVLLECRHQRGWFRTACIAVGLLGLGVAIGLVPSLIRSYVLTDSPVFPFANSIFKSKFADLDLAKQLPSYGSGFSLKVFTLPFRTVLTPASYNELGTYHPANWLLALFALALWPWNNTSSRRWWMVTAIFWLGWIMTEQNLRYSLPALACTMVAIASSGASPGTAWFKTSWIALLLVGLGVVLGYARPTAWIWGGASGPAFPRKFLTGEQTAEQFLAFNLPSSVLSKKVNAEFGTKAVVWQVPFVRDHQTFLGRTIAHPLGDIRQLAPLHSILPDRPQGASDEAIRQVISSAGITHVMWDVASWWISGRPESEWAGFYSARFGEKYFELEAAQNGAGSVRIYRVRSDAEIQKGPSQFVFQSWTEGEIPVKAGSLVGVQARWSSTPVTGAFFDVAGWSADGRMLIWSRVSLAYTTPVAWHRYWQTIPDGVTKLQIYPSPEAKGIEYAVVRPGK